MKDWPELIPFKIFTILPDVTPRVFKLVVLETVRTNDCVLLLALKIPLLCVVKVPAPDTPEELVAQRLFNHAEKPEHPVLKIVCKVEEEILEERSLKNISCAPVRWSDHTTPCSPEGLMAIEG
jgi:hypothetical protein